MSELKRVVNVIPLTRVALRSPQLFTYLVPHEMQDQIRTGQLVEVPFGNRRIYGITSSMEMHRLGSETRGLKTVVSLIDQIPWISERNLALGNWLASYYVCSLGLVLKAMLPKFVKKAKPPGLVGYERHNPDFVLTEFQRQAVTRISNLLDKSATVLLHGEAGSGKTEVYLQIVARLLQSQKQIIILVPEISLTAATIERFARRFGMENIAPFHSQLKASERMWMWKKIRDREKQIIIGPRSAIFSPVQDLGLIIIEEEHDPSFKQSDQNPKYHAVTVAQKLSELWQCPLILGDATPSVESYAAATDGKFLLLGLSHRIKADVASAKVQVIDLRKEPPGGKGFSVFSEFLKIAILDNLKEGKQIILFLNRRGAASSVMCRDCGQVALCRDCSVNLVWHRSAGKLICHHCGRNYNVPVICETCQGSRIGFFGLGTQLVEDQLVEFLKKEIPAADQLPKISRLDSDTHPAASLEIYRSWTSGKIRILIGTQMISKGWNMSRVGLVGIISADENLHLPDFRSNERTFQILKEVTGLTGRGSRPGTAILQTYHPENYAIEALKTHNYESFFRTEIKNRQKFGYPPMRKLVKLTISHKNEEQARSKASEVLEELLSKRQTSIEVLGPLPAFILKVRGQYQYLVILKLAETADFDLYSFLRDLPANINIDVDPEDLL